MKVEDIFNDAFLANMSPESSDVHQFLHAILVDTGGREEWAERQVRRLQDCLDIIERHGLWSEDVARRITSPDPRQFWGKVNELTTARYFENSGVGLSFNPVGRPGREGEFLLAFDPPVFVEVKSMFPTPVDERSANQLEILCEEAGRVRYPAWITIAIETEPIRDFRRGPFRTWLANTAPSLNESGSALYTDAESGLAARISFGASLSSPPIEASPWTGPVVLNTAETIARTLQRAIPQLPDDKPCVVVTFGELQFPIRPRHFLNALYGTLSVQIGPAISRWIRQTDGFFSPSRNTRVSAVAFMNGPSERLHPEPDMQLYHNPYAAHSLEPDSFAFCRNQALVGADASSDDGRRVLVQPFEVFADD